MQIDFDKRYPVAATPQQAWAVLADVRATVACFPGAAIATQVDARRYQGTIGLQVGDEAVRLDGGIELQGMDAARRELRLQAQGREAQGGRVAVQLVARIDGGDVPGASALAGRVTVTVDGRLAQLERRLLVGVGDRLLGQFAENFRTAAAAVPAPAARRGGRGAAGKRGAQLTSSAADSTLTLMVQAGQAPGAAFAARDGDATNPPAASGGAWSGLRRWWARLLGRG